MELNESLHSKKLDHSIRMAEISAYNINVSRFIDKGATSDNYTWSDTTTVRNVAPNVTMLVDRTTWKKVAKEVCVTVKATVVPKDLQSDQVSQVCFVALVATLLILLCCLLAWCIVARGKCKRRRSYGGLKSSSDQEECDAQCAGGNNDAKPLINNEGTSKK